MPDEVPQSFQKDVLNLLDRYSGGVKFTELLVKLADQELENSPKSPAGWVGMYNADEILRMIARIPNVGVLEYDWDMGGIIRAKYFIYTKYQR